MKAIARELLKVARELVAGAYDWKDPTRTMINIAMSVRSLTDEVENTPRLNPRKIKRIVTSYFSMPDAIDSWDEIDWRKVYKAFR